MKQVITLTTPGPFAAHFRSVGNPDFGQYAPISNPIRAVADSIGDLITAAMDYRDFWNLGSGNWPMPAVIRRGKKIGCISYNGMFIGEAA